MKRNRACCERELYGRRKAKGKEACTIRECLKDESGIGVVEIILILVILIGLVVIFKSQITSIVETIFEAITSGVSEVVE